MQWMEQNIDAYRIVAEILTKLRTTIRRELEVIHGRDWHRIGVPRELIERLIDRKELEKAIDWHETEYQELIDFAGFEDLLEILEHSPDVVPQVSRLAPSTALLHARFLELEVMRTKLGVCRPISETELSFLGTFHLRFLQAMEDDSERTPLPRPAPVPPADETADKPTAPADKATPEPSEPAAAAQEAAEREPVGEGEDAGTRPIKVVKAKPPSRAASAPAAADATTTATMPPAAARPAAASAPEPAPAPAPAPAPQPASEPARRGPAALEAALVDSEHRTILRQLYKEVMTIAEGMWTNDTPPLAAVWEKVCVSDWYETNFSKRGLKPLSDFYDVISQIQRRSNDGMTRDQLQRFLKESNFAQLLLALRDMFQKNQI